MSIESWKIEFYPKPASESTDSALEAARHSLLKWQGLLPENREKHSLTLERGDLFEGDDYFWVGYTSCALCLLADSNEKGDCFSCPMYKELGITCDGGLWKEFSYRNEVQPMVDVLTELVSVLEEKTLTVAEL